MAGLQWSDIKKGHGLLGHLVIRLKKDMLLSVQGPSLSPGTNHRRNGSEALQGTIPVNRSRITML
eukprot:5651142-Prorocentrum_lima.AAC.1